VRKCTYYKGKRRSFGSGY